MNKPVIGILSKHNEAGYKLRPNTLIRDEVKDAIFANGGIAIGILPTMSEIKLVDNDNEHEIANKLNELFTTQEVADLAQQIALCDGIILQGGIRSDAYEMWVAKYCYEHNIPTLAICAGQNNLVRGVGGSMKKVANPELHNQQTQDYVHDIKVTPDSLFGKIVGVDKMAVNSRHKNVINDPAGLAVVAYDNEGNIEVVEDRKKKFFLGMRFHPESLCKTDAKHNAIIKAFVQACRDAESTKSF